MNHPAESTAKLAYEIVEFANRARALLRLRIEQALQNDTRPNRDVVHWYLALGTLAWDISGSVMRLLKVGDVRAAMILNRSLFEYRVRIRFYTSFPDKASQAIHQLPTRIGKIDAAISDVPSLDHLSGDERNDLDVYVAKGVKIERENFRINVLEKVMPKEDADRYYDFFYAKVSAWVHGYETILPDVLYDHMHAEKCPKPHWRSKRLKVNDTAAVAIHHILDIVDEIQEARSLPWDFAILNEWLALEMVLKERGVL